jgi:hypothetical protein
VPGRIAAVAARATAEQRRTLEDALAREGRALGDGGDLAALARFVALFGDHFAAGKEARLDLAERLGSELERGRFLEAELHLLRLCGPQEEPARAARALDALARLCARKGLLEDAAHYYRLLGRDHARQVVCDGRTGADWLREAALDRRLLPYFDAPAPRTADEPRRVTEIRGRFPSKAFFPFEPDGDVLPFFRAHRLGLDLSWSQFTLVDRATGAERWRTGVGAVRLRNFLNGGNQPGLRLWYGVVGHLVVLNLGLTVYGLDPVDYRVLWKKDLVDQPYPADAVQVTGGGEEAPVAWLHRPSGDLMRAIGVREPLGATFVGVQTERGVEALDPLRGGTVWARSGVPESADLFGDGQHVYHDGDLAPYALRGHDGTGVAVPCLAALTAGRPRALGSRLLLSDNDLQTGLTLRLYDARRGQDLWQQHFAPGSVALKSEDPYLAGAVEPDGKVTVVDLRTQQPVLRATMERKHIDKVPEIHLVPDASRFFLLCNAPPDAANVQITPPTANAHAGLRGLPVNGWVYAFDRATGSLLWFNQVGLQSLLLERFEELPVLLFAGSHTRVDLNNERNGATQICDTLSIDRHTGKRLYEKRQANEFGPFHSVRYDARTGTVDLVAADRILRHAVTRAR